jgi:osmotically inducible protein OsmC
MISGFNLNPAVGSPWRALSEGFSSLWDSVFFNAAKGQGAIMKTTKKGYAVWQGGIKDGSGTISTETGVLKDAPYGFKSRFENGKGTNPEELIGAAHASCFSMALSLMLGEAGMTPERIETCATITLEKIGEGFEITHSHLDVKAKIPGADKARFDEVAGKAKAGCPVSRLFKATITMNAALET